MSTPNFPTTLGERVDFMRKQLRLTQDQLANKAGMTPQTINAIIHGRKSIRTDSVISLSKALGVSTDYLLLGQTSSRDEDSLRRKIGMMDERQYHYFRQITHNYCMLIGIDQDPLDMTVSEEQRDQIEAPDVGVVSTPEAQREEI